MVFKIPSFVFIILIHIICDSFYNCNIRGQSGLSSMCNISLLMCKVIANYVQAVLFPD